MSNSINTEAVQEIVDTMKAPEKFNFADAINQVSYPTGKVKVYLNGAKAGELFEKSAEIDELEADKAQIKAGSEGNGGIVDDPEVEEIDAKIEAAKAEQTAIIKEIQDSAMTFHMRGVAPAAWRAIDKLARQEFKLPKNATEEETVEVNISRNDFVNDAVVAHAITKVVNAQGAEDNSGWKREDAANLRAVLIESEWSKIKTLMEELTFATNLFADVAARDADFLPQP